ncbi:hypothetical protein KDC22_23825 [Paenibacillus tritici]|uniref:hypothetical protein n=1 Tax=Paenibacillus tritici TaxID=1873425 RepID=UPI001BAD915A|nr:hypothetical protein [Paenibacillus tritici]QUL53402.1 hypothetical protein KDC22_23825 [Paenibacillus tritici]
MIYLNLLGEGQETVNLLFRPRLIPIRERLMEQMNIASPGTVFYYDMNQVEGINGSGADEIIVKPIREFIKHYKTEDKYLVLINLSKEHDHIYNIDLTLKEENVTVVGKQDGDIAIIGSIGDSLREILVIAHELGEVTARDISDRMDKKLNLASTQLNKLNEIRLLKRYEMQLEEGGRQYVYRSLFY